MIKNEILSQTLQLISRIIDIFLRSDHQSPNYDIYHNDSQQTQCLQHQQKPHKIGESFSDPILLVEVYKHVSSSYCLSCWIYDAVPSELIDQRHSLVVIIVKIDADYYYPAAHYANVDYEETDSESEIEGCAVVDHDEDEDYCY